jgi:hypothetical protein
MSQKRDVRYIDRDFSSIREQLIEFTKNYFPDTYRDFTPTSPGMMVMEMVAYVGDVLSFYQDTQLQETFIQHAKDPKNLYNLAYMMGYRPKVTSAAQVNVQVIQLLPPSTLNPNIPDWSKTVYIAENMQLRGSTAGSPIFIVDKPVDFSYSSSVDITEQEVEQYDIDGNPTLFRLTKNVKAYSGQIKTFTKTFGNAERFATFSIQDSNIIGVLEVTDSSNDRWYEVPFLGQETILKEQKNQNADNNQVYNSLVLQKTPKRFVSRFTPSGELQLQFGAGIYPEDDVEFLPTTENVGLNAQGGISRIKTAYDPTNFLYTQTYGLAPSNTTLTIKYLVGGGITSNIPSDTLTEIQSINITPSEQLDNVFVNNNEAATGGSTGDSLEDIRQNSLRAFNEQNRVVTLQDYEVRCYSLPPSLGSIAKVFITQDQLTNTNSVTDSIIDSNPLALSLYVLSYDNEGKFATATSTLKQNLKKYLSQYIMLTDTVNIKDPYIVNIGVQYEIVVYPDQVAREVLSRCKTVLTNYFTPSNMNINKPINTADIITRLDKVRGVQSVQKLYFNNLVGGNYSPYAYDIEGATRRGTLYPSLDPSIFEVKFPEIDIKGRVTVL